MSPPVATMTGCFPPRDYQTTLTNDTRAALRRVRRVCVQLPTGGGKTVIAADMIAEAVRREHTVLFVAHRRELIDQCSGKLDAYGVDHGVIMAGHKRQNLDAPVQVASIQTWARRKIDFSPSLLFIDEAHRSIGPSYLDLVSAFPDAFILGLTATPRRLDGKGLDAVYQEIVKGPSVKKLIADGYLVQPRVFGWPMELGEWKRKKRGGDYVVADMAEAFDKPDLVGDIYTHWATLARDRPTVIYAINVEHAKHIADDFCARGVAAAYVHGGTPKVMRGEILRDWQQGRIQVVANCMVLVEGYDFPGLSCAIIARPTSSLVLFLQSIGRTLRPCEGKTDAIILDHTPNTHEHGLPQTDREWTLDGEIKGTAKPRECPHCHAYVSDPKATVCRECGGLLGPPRDCLVCEETCWDPDAESCPECGGALEELPGGGKGAIEHDESAALEEIDEETFQLDFRERKRRRKKRISKAQNYDDLVIIGRELGCSQPERWAQYILRTR